MIKFILTAGTLAGCYMLGLAYCRIACGVLWVAAPVILSTVAAFVEREQRAED